MSAARVRFAPSPTGHLHVGNIRTGLVNWLFARKAGGAFVLRFDDTDTERSRPEYVTGIRDDLRWLGLTWDEEAFQSERADRHAAVVETLKAEGRLYACYETPEELEYKRRRQRARGQPPIYDRAGLTLTDAERARLEAEGRHPHWRFRLDHEDIRWDDLVRGACHYESAHLSDPVLVRADGTLLYTLPSVVDDIDMAITHVIRGEDHVVNTAVQIQLCRLLGGTPPTFAHLSLMTDVGGGGLSKRLGSVSVADLRSDGLEPMAVNALLARLGTSDDVAPVTTLDALADTFDLGHFGRAAPKFDPADLARLNARLLHGLDYDAAKPRLAALKADGGPAFWDAVRGNLERFADVAEWHAVAFGDVVPRADAATDAGFLRTAAEALPEEPWDAATWSTWTGALKAATGRKGKGLFMPLRLALTGQPKGPELAALLPLIGRARALDRLRRAAADGAADRAAQAPTRA
ncbi:glutamate--tRNA ligase [Roseospira marina]|uniref:Glutamate--tRNA ligase n=1 Tax=Roseospira marina TaxID=140057 RepID=A0A5M6ICR6_9PROT|nr:glutamate--tRNA ligase [Roseospira marina]KAA5606070.1 glutamate--tRNA ligase [Roseospira marina]MBB4313066.1 glutamyl-tRNA synthetase [Roseospira marina]MBB5086193.1 glutamyl-tRNA synthetase [Roseospira marina]